MGVEWNDRGKDRWLYNSTSRKSCVGTKQETFYSISNVPTLSRNLQSDLKCVKNLAFSNTSTHYGPWSRIPYHNKWEVKSHKKWWEPFIAYVDINPTIMNANTTVSHVLFYVLQDCASVCWMASKSYNCQFCGIWMKYSLLLACIWKKTTIMNICYICTISLPTIKDSLQVNILRRYFLSF